MKFIATERPASIEFTSLAELYLHYQRLFLDGEDFAKDWITASGHRVRAFDRNFLHLVKVSATQDGRVVSFFERMHEEKPRILGCTNGFGPYSIELRRGQLLAAALDTLLRPHAVIELAVPQSAHLAFFRRYEDVRAPGMIMLIGESKNERCLVPFSAYSCRKNQIKNWFSHGNRIVWWDRAAVDESGGTEAAAESLVLTPEKTDS